MSTALVKFLAKRGSKWDDFKDGAKKFGKKAADTIVKHPRKAGAIGAAAGLATGYAITDPDDDDEKKRKKKRPAYLED